jgi:hypothetical protein
MPAVSDLTQTVPGAPGRIAVPFLMSSEAYAAIDKDFMLCPVVRVCIFDLSYSKVPGSHHVITLLWPSVATVE